VTCEVWGIFTWNAGSGLCAFWVLSIDGCECGFIVLRTSKHWSSACTNSDIFTHVLFRAV
jgi:hypothetical protein